MKALPTSQEIENFLEIYRIRNLTKAAIRLGITQPSLTQSLQKLEQKTGTVLFHRTKQGLVSTDAGNQFFGQASRILEDWEGFHSILSTSKTELQGRFRVGCHSSVGGYALPKFFMNLEKIAPKIEIDLIHDLSRKINEGIVSYDIDLAYVVNPIRHPDTVLRKLGEDQVRFWKKKGQKDPPKILFSNQNMGQVESLRKKTTTKYFHDWKWIHTESLELIRTLVTQGIGVGILPERIAKAESDTLAIYDADLPSYSDEIYLVYRKEALKSMAGQALIQAAFYQI
jgi:DNA-binding transcriptional LysR family regulator